MLVEHWPFTPESPDRRRVRMPISIMILLGELGAYAYRLEIPC